MDWISCSAIFDSANPHAISLSTHEPFCKTCPFLLKWMATFPQISYHSLQKGRASLFFPFFVTAVTQRKWSSLRNGATSLTSISVDQDYANPQFSNGSCNSYYHLNWLTLLAPVFSPCSSTGNQRLGHIWLASSKNKIGTCQAEKDQAVLE